MFKQIKIEDVVLKKRIRKNLGDLGALIKSLHSFGLIHPIILNKKNELIAGHRRLEAAKQLGWKLIDAIIIDKPSELEKLELEMEENLYRKNLTSEELEEGYRKMEKLRNPGFLIRLFRAICNFFRRLFGRKPRTY
ncbi:MAG: chromosome partitioning protein ParB [Spirochaetales bacterium]|nr:MAG: chromosome partitioning protein ParB [Spirochaetales bacterium]